AHPPAAAPILVDQYDPVFGALVDGTGRAGGRAGRVQAVLADPGQEEHERLLVLLPDPVGDLPQDRVPGGGLVPTRQRVVPVRRPGDLRRLAGNQRGGPGHRRVFAGRGGEQVLVLIRPRLVVVLDGR